MPDLLDFFDGTFAGVYFVDGEKMSGQIHSVRKSTQFKREHKADYGREKIKILYEDDFLIVILKPSGMLSVPYPGSKAKTAIDSLETLMRKRGTFSANKKPLVVHRLDRDTSGVMMFALNTEIQRKIMKNWQTMVTERVYRAVAENPKDKNKYLSQSGTIDLPLAKNAHNVGYVPNRADDTAKTVPAKTHYKIIVQGKTHTLFELELETGKKNQIRAHLSSKGYPLAGDENYRAKTDPFHRLLLHARSLAFVHPITKETLRFENPEPPEWEKYVKTGDFHPEPPVWQNGSFSQKSRSAAHTAYTANSGVKGAHLSKKALSSLDFIAKGKLRAKH